MPNTNTRLLRLVDPRDIARHARPPVDRATLDAASAIIDEVRTGGEPAVRRFAERFGERRAGEPLQLGRPEMRRALDSMPTPQRNVLERAADRIGNFARAQRAAEHDLEVSIPGGRAGHTVLPVERAACYAPAGRYPLPSSVLMTAVTARAAGCPRVVVASPGAHPVMLAAAAIAGADEFFAVGGAHAIAALALGIPGLEPCDVIVGPGNRWVTAAKQLLVGTVGIDMLAGPSELLIIADESADAAQVAADLLAQAEHDTDAVPVLISTSATLIEEVETALRAQLESLPTRETARAALTNGLACIADSLEHAAELSDRLAPEHLELHTARADELSKRIRNAGAVFIGASSAEVIGDYAAGPNHTLPTGGNARFQSGLSVHHFLRRRTWIRIDDAALAHPLFADARDLGLMEGLHAHAAAAARRLAGA